jgi:hypothetical protein
LLPHNQGTLSFGSDFGYGCAMHSGHRSYSFGHGFFGRYRDCQSYRHPFVLAKGISILTVRRTSLESGCGIDCLLLVSLVPQEVIANVKQSESLACRRLIVDRSD